MCHKLPNVSADSPDPRTKATVVASRRYYYLTSPSHLIIDQLSVSGLHSFDNSPFEILDLFHRQVATFDSLTYVSNAYEMFIQVKYFDINIVFLFADDSGIRFQS